MNRIFKVATLSGLLAALSFGQTTLTTTTLSANITSSQTVFAVASATGITGAGTLGQYTTMLYVGHELMGVRSVSGTNITVDRAKWAAPPGEASTTAHKSGGTVWIGVPTAFVSVDPFGQCVRTALTYVPVINTASGKKFDCLGLTTAGAVVETDRPGVPVLGAIVASSAGVMTPSGTAFHVSGTAAITGITVPAGWGSGMSLYIIPDAAFTWTTATNISLAGTAVANKLIIFTWDGVKWNPSVIA